MKALLVDLYKLKNLYTGLGQFSMNFAHELISQNAGDIEITFLIPKNSRFETDPDVKFVHADFQKRYFPFLNKDFGLWHSLQQFPSHFPNKRTPQLLTIHDLNFLIGKSKTKRVHYLKKLQENVDRADTLTTISQYTKDRIREHLKLRGKEVKVIYNGVSLKIPRNTPSPGYIRDKKFFFSVGVFSSKKNFLVLLGMMKHFKDYDLVLAGDHETPYGKEIRAEITRLNLGDRVLLPGKINDADKYWLYENCEAFLFPSLAEGFGMPVIEAMQCGKPVFLSRFTSLPEIGGDAAFYFDHFDDLAMASLVQQKLSAIHHDGEAFSRKTKEHAEKFTWERCMSEYLSLYRSLLNLPGSR